MEYRLKIRRFDGGEHVFWQTFLYESAGDVSVARALEELNERTELRDCAGNAALPIAWDCSCLEKKCGACAMVINGKPRLACASLLRDVADKTGQITLEPLKKFPCIQDLRVRRAVLFENLEQMGLWLENEAVDTGEEDRKLHYKAASCLMCGLCLEVCPNFSPKGDFAGALSAMAAFHTFDQSELGEHRRQIRQQYRRRFYDGCAKSLACQEVCPAKIPIERLLVKTNAAAIWHRGEKRR